MAGREALPDFSEGRVAFITFNYDRSLEQFLYESLYYSFMEALDDRIVQYFEKLKIPVETGQFGHQNRERLTQVIMGQLKILHVYGQIMPLKWQDSNDGLDYQPHDIDEALLRKAADNIRTIYEQKESPEIKDARGLLSEAEQVFFLGFGYAAENMEVLDLPKVIPAGNCRVYGTAFGLYDTEVERVTSEIRRGLTPDQVDSKNPKRIVIRAVDCLELLRNYLD